jgi:molybdopterin converting factor small subunit
MEVYVTLFETLKKHQPRSGKAHLEDGSRVKDLLVLLGIPVEDVGLLIVNRKDAVFDQPLKDKDAVTIIPPLGGG